MHCDLYERCPRGRTPAPAFLLPASSFPDRSRHTVKRSGGTNMSRTQEQQTGRRLTFVIALAMAALVSAMTFSAPSRAATTAGYPNALVEFQASTRTEPRLANSTYWG